MERYPVQVDPIAASAGASVQTRYTHFGSKRGLLMAVIVAVQRHAGTYADFEQVWQSPDGETALRRILEATLRIWDRAWPVVEFSECARRRSSGNEPESGAEAVVLGTKESDLPLQASDLVTRGATRQLTAG